jgi:hypothetical protein
MTNPYEPPVQRYEDRSVHNLVGGPALALIIVSLIAIGCGGLGLLMDIVLLATGVVARLEVANRGPVSEYTLITVRTIWGVALIIASSFVLYRAIQMRNLKNFEIARAAAIVAMVPFLGPCCILGIPFGIWAFITLGKPGVRDAFHRHS